MAGNRYYAGPLSDHFDGGRFFNPDYPVIDPSLADLLRWRLGGHRKRWAIEPSKRVVPAPAEPGLVITLIGHASLLLQVAGLNVLVDPVWAERASPFGFAGPQRVNAPGIDLDDLPSVDAILLTHNHYDHLDIPTIRRLWEKHRPRIIAPLGNDRVVNREARDVRIETYDWYQSIALNDGVTVWLHPANHWSARGTGDRQMALWCGFVVRTANGTIYIAGDTGYGDGRVFRDVLARHGAPDVAVLPIGAYEPRWFMKNQHIDPAEAVQVMLDCDARQALGVHWGTFPLTDEPRLAPRDALRCELTRRAIPQDRFLALEAGDIWRKPNPAI